MKLTLKSLAQKVLEEAKTPLSANEIWEVAKEKGYDGELQSIGKTPWMSISAQIYRELVLKPESSIFELFGENPRRIKLRSSTIVTSNVLTETFSTPDSVSERDSYPEVARFIRRQFGAYSKIIDDRKSKKGKKGENEWMHPDIVACYFPFEDWNTEVYDLARQLTGTPQRLYAFEVKKEIRYGDLRQSYFQAVSNSSWANEAYLVAANFPDKDEDFIEELRRLSAAFGIGIIELDKKDPEASLIIVGARYNEQLDWITINKIAGLNPDFKDFITKVGKDSSTKNVSKEWYQKVE